MPVLPKYIFCDSLICNGVLLFYYYSVEHCANEPCIFDFEYCRVFSLGANPQIRAGVGSWNVLFHGSFYQQR